ncbi:MAG TPA: transcriptional regulator [Rhizobium sp.]|nr:transcriptional regulator [Rhizobium sp.]
MRRLIPGISQRMLTLDLRRLEEANLVRRTIYSSVPVKVEYALMTDRKRLEKVVSVVREIGLWLKARG